METYKLLGIIGLIVVLIFSILFFLPFTFSYSYYGFGMMGYYHHYYIMMGYPIMIFPLLIGGLSIILALIGLAINDRIAAGILLILAAFVSIPIMFGGFGIGFILLLLSGIIALIK